jgi:hypothetical protein
LEGSRIDPSRYGKTPSERVRVERGPVPFGRPRCSPRRLGDNQSNARTAAQLLGLACSTFVPTSVRFPRFGSRRPTSPPPPFLAINRIPAPQGRAASLGHRPPPKKFDVLSVRPVETLLPRPPRACEVGSAPTNKARATRTSVVVRGSITRTVVISTTDRVSAPRPPRGIRCQPFGTPVQSFQLSCASTIATGLALRRD